VGARIAELREDIELRDLSRERSMVAEVLRHTSWTKPALRK
jgi:hypothetical protein